MWSSLNQALEGSPSAPPSAGLAWEAAQAGGSWPASAADLLQSAQALSGPVGQHPQSPGQPQPAWATVQQLGPEPHSQHHTAASKIYVQGLPQSLQHPVAVAGLFSPFGDVLDVKLYAAEVRLSGGSAVVRMRSTTQAATAIAALNGIVPEGGWQQLTVRAAETAEQRSSRIVAINGRQGTGLAPPSPMQHSALPPAGPGAALRRVHSARATSSAGSLQCFTGGLMGQGQGDMPVRRSVDWASCSLDSSRRSSMDAMRCGRSSSDSGSEELPALAAEAAALPTGALQRMLLEAVLALVGQVETGQISLPSMRVALETALSAAKQATGEEALGATIPQGGYVA